MAVALPDIWQDFPDQALNRARDDRLSTGFYARMTLGSIVCAAARSVP